MFLQLHLNIIFAAFYHKVKRLYLDIIRLTVREQIYSGWSFGKSTAS